MRRTVRLFLQSMNRKYKIGNFIAEIISAADFLETKVYSQFLYNGDSSDYKIYVDFAPLISVNLSDILFETDDRVYFAENGGFCCYYKSRENGAGFYAKRKTDSKMISILIDDKYRSLLRADVIFSLAGIEEAVIKNNGCILHSSFIETEGEALLFTGPCTVGKSTQAHLWERYRNAVVVNGDKSLIFRKDGTYYASGLPFSGSSRECLNKTLPLKAIVCLSKGRENSISKSLPPQSFYDVYKNCYPVSFSEDLTAKLIEFISDLSSSIPIFSYCCLPDESAVNFLYNELF